MTPVLLYLLKVNIALLLFYLAYRYGLRRLTFYTANRAFLLFGIVFSSLYPLIDISRLLKKHTEIAGGVVYYLPNFSTAENPSTFNLPELLILVFWSGVAVMAFRFIIQVISLLRLHLSGRSGKVENMEVKLIDEKINPFSFFGNIYVNPSLHSRQELKTILEHEKIHVSDWHSADIILGELNRIFYWFNPGVWLMMTAIRENLEFITDRKILQKGTDAQEYQYSLVRVSNIPYATSLVNNFNFSHLKARITMMDKKPSSELHLLKYLVLVPFVAALALVVNACKTDSAKKQEVKVEEFTNKVLPADTLPTEAPGKDLIAENLKMSFNKAKWVENIKSNDPVILNGGVLNDYSKLKDIKDEEVAIMATFSNQLADYYVKDADVVYWIETNDAPDIKNRPAFIPPPPPIVKEVKFTPPKVEEEVKVKEVRFTAPVIVKADAIKIEENREGGPTVHFFTNKTKKGDDINETDKGTSIVIAKKGATNYSDGSVKMYEPTGFFLKDSTKNPIVIIDGEISTYKEMESIKSGEIKSINILKGADAEAKYGSKGKNEVIIIVTKPSAAKEVNKVRQFRTWSIPSGDTLPENKTKELESVTVVGYPMASNIKLDPVVVVGYPLQDESGEPLVYIDGKLNTYAEMKKMPADEIDHINVLKGEKAIEKYGKDGKDGVILIISKKQAEKMAEWHKNQGKNPPLYIVDGKRTSDKEFQKLDRNDIKAINVYKDAEAIEKYGNKAKHGVVVITTKDADKKD